MARLDRFPRMGTSAIVTGGAGFIGSHVVDALLADGYAVTVIDDLSTGDAARVDGAAKLVELDIVDAPALEAVFAEAKPSAIFHLAAQASVVVSVEHPGRDCEVNVQGTLNVLRGRRALRGAGGVHLDRRRAVRRRGADAHRRGQDPRAAVAVWRIEVGGGGVRQHVVAARRASRTRCAGSATCTARARARMARPAWWRSSPTTCTPGARPSCTAMARRRATTCTWATSSARC